MNFFVTLYVYPIKERMVLSKELGFCLDNPRTNDDIELVKKSLGKKVYCFPQTIFLLEEKDDNFKA